MGVIDAACSVVGPILRSSESACRRDIQRRFLFLPFGPRETLCSVLFPLLSSWPLEKNFTPSVYLNMHAVWADIELVTGFRIN